MQQRSPERWRSPSRKRAAPKPPHSRVIIASLSPTGDEQRCLGVLGRPDDPPDAVDEPTGIGPLVGRRAERTADRPLARADEQLSAIAELGQDLVHAGADEAEHPGPAAGWALKNTSSGQLVVEASGDEHEVGGRGGGRRARRPAPPGQPPGPP